MAAGARSADRSRADRRRRPLNLSRRPFVNNRPVTRAAVLLLGARHRAAARQRLRVPELSRDLAEKRGRGRRRRGADRQSAPRSRALEEQLVASRPRAARTTGGLPQRPDRAAHILLEPAPRPHRRAAAGRGPPAPAVAAAGNADERELRLRGGPATGGAGGRPGDADDQRRGATTRRSWNSSTTSSPIRLRRARPHPRDARQGR